MPNRRQVFAGSAALLAAAALPGRGFAATDRLRLALSHEPPQLDPVAGDDPATLAVSYQNIFEGLTRLDARGAVQPGLARSWTVAPDGLSYTFALEDQARYHDGTGFDAGHVVFSLKRLLSPDVQGPGRAALAAVADVAAALDDLTAKVTLSRPDPDLLHALGLPAAAMVAPESAGNNRAVPLGTGPFAFVEWSAGESIALERNEGLLGGRILGSAPWISCSSPTPMPASPHCSRGRSTATRISRMPISSAGSAATPPFCNWPARARAAPDG